MRGLLSKLCLVGLCSIFMDKDVGYLLFNTSLRIIFRLCSQLLGKHAQGPLIAPEGAKLVLAANRWALAIARCSLLLERDKLLPPLPQVLS